MTLRRPIADAQPRPAGTVCAAAGGETAAESAPTNARTGAGRTHHERAGFDPRRSPSPRPEVGPAQRGTRGRLDSPAGSKRRSGKLDRNGVYHPAAAFGTPRPTSRDGAERKNQPRGASADTAGAAHRKQGQRGDGRTGLIGPETPPYIRGGDLAAGVTKPRVGGTTPPGEPGASHAPPRDRAPLARNQNRATFTPRPGGCPPSWERARGDDPRSFRACSAGRHSVPLPKHRRPPRASRRCFGVLSGLISA